MRYGYCSDCCNVDSEDERAQMKWLERVETLPIPDLLKLLDEAVLRAVSAAATDAVARLGSERIYGFILQHYIFRNCNVAVLTEDQYERSVRKHAERSPSLSIGVDDRWWAVDVGYNEYGWEFCDQLFISCGNLITLLEDRQQEEEVARIFIRAMRHVRDNIITDPRIVLSVMDYTEGPSFPFYAYAELFNDTATLAWLKEELAASLKPMPFWDLLEFARSRIPKG